ncbi:M23 family metallopeptidase [Caulobacter segnis]
MLWAGGRPGLRPWPSRPRSSFRSSPRPRRPSPRRRPLSSSTAPLPGRVVNSPFGLRQLPWEENGRLHEGVDIAAPGGALVKAAADGVVKRHGDQPDLWPLRPDPAQGRADDFLCSPRSSLPKGVQRGTYLHRGDTVAFVGNSGRSTGSHLHFEIRKGDKALNPTFFLGRSFRRSLDLPLKAAGRASRARFTWPRSPNGRQAWRRGA